MSSVATNPTNVTNKVKPTNASNKSTNSTNKQSNASNASNATNATNASGKSMLPKISTIQIAIQVVLGIVIIIVLYIVSLVVLNIDSLVVSSDQRVKPKQVTNILNGYAPVSYLNNKSYNTISHHNNNNYKKIGKSINTMGGSQFTYQCWIKIKDANDDNFKDLVLLLKGDKRKYNLGYYTKQEGDKLKLHHAVNAQYGVTAPLIKFTDSYRGIQVQMNTSKDPLVKIDIKMNNSPGNHQNLLSLLAINNWYLFTFVFVDHFQVKAASETGIGFFMYVNDIPYVEQNASTMPELRGNTLKQNDGNLHIFPDLKNSSEFMSVGNIKYYNYALVPKQIKKVFEMGPPTVPSSIGVQRKDSPSYLSAYNKIDIYNY
jgi:hypothetical protein